MKNIVSKVALASMVFIVLQGCSKNGFLESAKMASASITTKVDSEEQVAEQQRSGGSSTTQAANISAITSNSAVTGSPSSARWAADSGSSTRSPASVTQQIQTSSPAPAATQAAQGCSRAGLSSTFYWYNLALNKQCSSNLEPMAEGSEKKYISGNDYINVQCKNGKYVYDDMITAADLLQVPYTKSSSCGGTYNSAPILKISVNYRGHCYTNQPDADGSFTSCKDIREMQVIACNPVEIYMNDFNLLSQKLSSYKVDGAISNLGTNGVFVQRFKFNTIHNHMSSFQATQNGRTLQQQLSFQVSAGPAGPFTDGSVVDCEDN